MLATFQGMCVYRQVYSRQEQVLGALGSRGRGLAEVHNSAQQSACTMEGQKGSWFGQES